MIDCVNNGVEGSCFSSIGGWGGVDLVFFLNDLSHFFVACSHFRINKLMVMVNGQRSTVVVDSSGQSSIVGLWFPSCSVLLLQSGVLRSIPTTRIGDVLCQERRVILLLIIISSPRIPLISFTKESTKKHAPPSFYSSPPTKSYDPLQDIG